MRPSSSSSAKNGFPSSALDQRRAQHVRGGTSSPTLLLEQAARSLSLESGSSQIVVASPRPLPPTPAGSRAAPAVR